MSGFAEVAAPRERNAAADLFRLVFSTGHADAARLETLERGPVVSLLEPYDLTTLLNAIERVAG